MSSAQNNDENETQKEKMIMMLATMMIPRLLYRTQSNNPEMEMFLYTNNNTRFNRNRLRDETA